MKDIANAYTEILMTLDLTNPVIFKGLKEGLNKFLSNAYLSSKQGNKYEKGHYYSQEAYRKIKAREFTDLVFEHMVPKHKYIQKPCVEKAIKKELKENDVYDLLERYWKIAIITKEEDKKLVGRSMPKGWDGEDIFLRYKLAGIQLIPKEKLTW
jgi:hypothetical protein